MAVKGAFVAAPKFNTKEDAQKMVDLYFKECEGEALTDENGKAVYTSKGDVVYIRQPKPPTVTGLALALGFAARKELLTYRGPRDIMEVIERAKSRVEEYMERQLFEQDSFKWARLGLEKDFGMRFDEEEEQGGKVIIVDDIPEGTGSWAENEPKTDGGAGEAGREAKERQEAEVGAEAEIEESGEEKEAGKVHEDRGQEAGKEKAAKKEAHEKVGLKEAGKEAEAEKRQGAEFGAEAEKEAEKEIEPEESVEENEAGKVHEDRGQEAGKEKAAKKEVHEKGVLKEAGRKAEAEKGQEAEIGAEAEKEEEAEAEIEENGEENEAGKVHEDRGQEAGKMEAEEKTGRKACDFTYGGALGAAENETS